MAYFAQFDLDAPCVAMVTASHNENGWTGVKMGAQPAAHLRPRRDGPAEGDRARRRPGSSAAGGADPRRGRRRALYRRRCQPGQAQAAAEGGLRLRQRHGRRLRAARPCAAMGVPRWSRWTASSTGPSPSTIPIPKTASCCTPWPRRCASRRRPGLGFDGDGDRCGVVDDEGEEIFADKIGLMLARDLSRPCQDATFVVDVKSTGLFATDPVLTGQRRQDRLLEDRPLLHQAPRRARRAGGLREVRPLLLQPAARPRL